MAVDDTKALFFDRNLCALTPLDPEKARGYLADLSERAQSEDLSQVVELLRNGKAQSFLGAVLDLSPFIRESLIRHPGILARIASSPPEAALKDILTEISNSGTEEGVTEAALMTSLRQRKREAHEREALAEGLVSSRRLRRALVPALFVGVVQVFASLDVFFARLTAQAKQRQHHERDDEHDASHNASSSKIYDALGRAQHNQHDNAGKDCKHAREADELKRAQPVSSRRRDLWLLV